MGRKTRDDGATAVIERGKPDDIAARVAALEVEARRAEATADVEQFRKIVAGIAEGIEPDGKTLAAIGDLGRRLRLPPDSVSIAVKAIRDERRLQAECDRTTDRIKSVTGRRVELAAEMKAAEAKLLALREELAEYVGLQQGYPHQAMAVAHVRNENPLLFAPVSKVTDRLVAVDSGMGTAMFDSMKTQEWRVEGHVSRSVWEK